MFSVFIKGFVLLLVFMSTMVYSMQLELRKEKDGELSVLWDASTGRALCFPQKEEILLSTSIVQTSQSLDLEISLQRIGQVFCRQLGYSYLERMAPLTLNLMSQIHFGASCWGYEPLISHCNYEEYQDFGNACNKFVGLYCKHCYQEIELNTNDAKLISNPKFPDLYIDGTNCEWVVKSKDSALVFMISIFKLVLPDRNGNGMCSTGFLEIGGTNNYNKNRAILCGTLPASTLRINASEVHIRWFSGIFHPRPSSSPGFQLSLELVKENQGESKYKELNVTTPINQIDENNGASKVLRAFGITSAVFVIIVFLFGVFIGVKHLLRKKEKRKNRRRMAMTLRTKTPRKTLPTPPEKEFLQIECNEGRRSSVTSIIYEDIENNRSRSPSSYISLGKESRINHSKDYKFGNDHLTIQVPHLKITSFEDLKSQSEPSEMPSNLSRSALDSVFSSVIPPPKVRKNQPPHPLLAGFIPKEEELKESDQKQGRRGTYVVNTYDNASPPKTRSKNLFKNLFQSSLDFRYASEPNVRNLNYSTTGSPFLRMESSKFNTSHIM